MSDLWEACKDGSLACVKYLVSEMISDINWINSGYHGYSPLMIALDKKHVSG